MSVIPPGSIHVDHGTWVPGSDSGFDNHGRFVFWVETPSNGTGRDRRSIKPHPGQLSDPGSLQGFLATELKFGKPVIGQLSQEPVSFWAVLPGAGDAPLPSIEMARMTGEYLPDDPEDFGWRNWEIQGLAISRPLLFLKELRYAISSGRATFLLGSDLEFWIRYSRVFRKMVADHQFLPVMKCHQPRRRGTRLQIHSG